MPSVPAAGVPDKVPFAAKVTPEGRDPVSLKLIGVSPLAVTEKVAALLAVKVAAAAEVNAGADVLTVRVKAWVLVFELRSVALMVTG